MKNNKKLAIAGASALGLAVVGFGAFQEISTLEMKNLARRIEMIQPHTNLILVLQMMEQNLL